MDQGRDRAARCVSVPAPPGRDRRGAADRRFARRGASHDARLALSTIRALLATQLEREPRLPPDVFESLHDAAREADRLTVLLGPDVGRHDAGTCDAAVLAHDVARAQATCAGIPVTCHGRAAHVAGDATTVWRVLTNLVHNACRAAGPGGSVCVAVTSGDHPCTVAVRVRDSGPGFATHRQAGIGLDVVARLVGELGGTVGVDTAPGGGTEIQVTLRAATPAWVPAGCVPA